MPTSPREVHDEKEDESQEDEIANDPPVYVGASLSY